MKKIIQFYVKSAETILQLQKDLEWWFDRVFKECDIWAYGYDYDIGLNIFFEKTRKLNKIVSVINNIKLIQESR